MPAQTLCGAYDISVGAAWAVTTSNEYRSMTTAPAAQLADGKIFCGLSVKNSHNAQFLYIVLTAANVADPTTNCIKVDPGQTVEIDMSTLWSSAVSYQGSGAGTTGSAVAHFRV